MNETTTIITLLIAVVLAATGLGATTLLLIGAFLKRPEVVKASAIILAGAVLGLFMLMAVQPGMFGPT